MSERVKRWVIGAVAAAVFAFLGWQAATLLKHREPLPPQLASAQPKAQNPPPKAPSRKAPKVVRDISRPQPIEIPVATNELRVREAARPQSVAISPATLPFASEALGSSDTSKAQPAVRIVSDFEGAPEATFTRFSDTYWAIDVKEKTEVGPARFFLFRVQGAAGRTITFEIRNAPGSWATLNPTYSYVKSLDDPSAFRSSGDSATQVHKPSSRSRVPDTSGQQWHFIERTELRPSVFSFMHAFDQDAYVCMRYPYTPGYNEQYLNTLTNNPLANVIMVGTSKKGRPLRIVKIGEGAEQDEKRKPCVLIYARENPDEQDGSWVAQGVIDFLSSEGAGAGRIRQRFTFLVIPLLDPDGAARGAFESEVLESFYSAEETPESVAYGAFFKQWADKGNPLYLAVNVHSTVPYLVSDRAKPERLESAIALQGFINPVLWGAGFPEQKSKRIKTKADLRARLGTWLSTWYGTLQVPFAVNVQEPSRHLTISELRKTGELLALGTAKFLDSEDAQSLVASVDALRRERAERWARYGTKVTGTTAFAAELECRWQADSEAALGKWEFWQAEQLQKFHF